MAKVHLGSDPTYQRMAKTCPECSHDEAIFFQSREKVVESMKLNFACTNKECGYRFVD